MKKESDSKFFDRIINPYEIKSYHKPLPLPPSDEQTTQASITSAKKQDQQVAPQKEKPVQRQYQQPSLIDYPPTVEAPKQPAISMPQPQVVPSTTVPPTIFIPRSLPNRPDLDYYSKQEELTILKKDILKQTLESQLSEVRERKRIEKINREEEDIYWEERAKRELAVINERNEREKERERAIRSKAGEVAARHAVPGDAIDKLRHEIFDKDKKKAEKEKSAEKAPEKPKYNPIYLGVSKPGMSFEELQKHISAKYKKKKGTDQSNQKGGENYLNASIEGSHQSSQSPSPEREGSVGSREPVRDYEKELQEFREMREARLKEHGEIQKPLHHYLGLHKKVYDLGNPQSTRMYNQKKSRHAEFGIDLDDNAAIEYDGFIPPPYNTEKVPKPIKQTKGVLTKHLPASASIEDRRIVSLEKQTIEGIDSLRGLNYKLRQEQEAGKLRVKLIENLNPRPQPEFRDYSTSSKTYAFKGMEVPRIDWEGEIAGKQRIQDKYAEMIFDFPDKSKLKVNTDWEKIRHKQSKPFQVGTGIKLNDQLTNPHIEEIDKTLADIINHNT